MIATSFPAIEHEILAGIRAEVESPALFDLGCGVNPAEGFVGVDKFAKGEGILHADLFVAPWPFADESVDMFVSSHFVEHVPSWDLHWGEVYRCLKPGGYVRLIGPHANSNRAKQDPDHKQHLLEERFAYLERAWQLENGVAHYEAPVNFSRVFLGYAWHPDYVDKSPDVQMWALAHYINVVDDVIAIFRKEPLPQ